MLSKLKRLFLALLISSSFTGQAFSEIDQKEFDAAMKKFLASEEGQTSLGSTVEAYFSKKQAEAKKNQAEKQQQQLEEQFKNPVKIAAGNSPSKGPKNARVTIIEFSDFQCPYCSRADKTIKEVLQAYPEDVRVVFKNLPLGFHKQAEPAARAALAAGEQGKFWEMHDALFENQRKLSEDLYMEQAKKLGLDMEKFTKDYNSEAIKKQVQEDAKLARKHGITGTPGFFVNGVAVRGAYPASHFKMIIDRWLKEDA